jgi:hypothetical protein
VTSVGQNSGIDPCLAARRSDGVGIQVRALLEQRRQRALVLDAQRVRPRQHRAAVVADAGAVTRRARVIERGLAARGVLRRRARRPRRDHERSANESFAATAHDRIPPRIERKFAGQTPARPGEMMPFG